MLAVAAVLARRGTCIKKQVGCVLTDARGRILAAGYNGPAAGTPHCNEEKLEGADYRVDEEHSRKVGMKVEKPGRTLLVYPHACNGGRPFPSGADLCEAVHAEQNALLQCREPDEARSVYLTVQPCLRCAKTLLNTGARRLVFGELYADEPQALELWRRGHREAWLAGPDGLRQLF
jgi:dCMP deaminase